MDGLDEDTLEVFDISFEIGLAHEVKTLQGRGGGAFRTGGYQGHGDLVGPMMAGVTSFLIDVVANIATSVWLKPTPDRKPEATTTAMDHVKRRLEDANLSKADLAKVNRILSDPILSEVLERAVLRVGGK